MSEQEKQESSTLSQMNNFNYFIIKHIWEEVVSLL